MEPTRQEFLLAIAGAAALPRVSPAQTARGKMLIVVAHPDDESAFAASTYRLVRELGWIADQVTITDGASGYRYATLAEKYYGVALTTGSDGHARLAAIRKEEALGAGKVLGIRQHYFLDQKDLGFERNAAAAETGNWDRAYIRGFLSALLTRERYDAVFALLPTQEAHAHHRAATLLALEAVANLPDGRRPLVFGAEPRSRSDAPLAFASPPAQPLARTTGAAPVVTFHRDSSFGYHGALNYQIVANWVIAEHKSQGLFQNDYSRHECEQFWLFEASGKDALERLPRLRALLQEPAHTAAAPRFHGTQRWHGRFITQRGAMARRHSHLLPEFRGSGHAERRLGAAGPEPSAPICGTISRRTRPSFRRPESASAAGAVRCATSSCVSIRAARWRRALCMRAFSARCSRRCPQ